MAVRARHVVCFLGEWKDFDAVEARIAEVGGEGFRLDEEYSALAKDPRMPRAFEASRDRVVPSFEPIDEEAIAKHQAVAYVLSPPMEPAGAQELLGEPDVEMPRLIDPIEAVRWIDALTIYLTAEKPDGGLRDGETFRPTEDDARRVLRARSCERYEDDDFLFNPNGYWNLDELRPK